MRPAARWLVAAVPAVLFAPVAEGGDPEAHLPPLPRLAVESYGPGVRERVGEAYEVARLAPRSAEASGRLGMLLYNVDQFEFAEACFERASALRPAEARWPYYLGWARSKLAQHAAAAASLEEALRLTPGYVPARLKLAESLRAAGRVQEAKTFYRALVADQRGLAEAHYGLGRVLLDEGDLVGSVEHLQEACDLFPRFGAAHYALAGALRDRGENEKAREHLRRYQEARDEWPVVPDELLAELLALKIGPDARLDAGMQLARSGNLQAAIAEHLAALEADPSLVQIHVNLMALYGLTGRADLVEEHYRTALALAPDRADVHVNYGVFLSGRSETDGARQAFRRALEIDPANGLAHDRYARLLMGAGELEEAAQHFGALLALRPLDRNAHFLLGGILMRQGKPREAIDHLLKTLSPDDEETPRCAHALAAAYARAGDRENALAYLREAREKAIARGRLDLVSPIERDLRVLDPAEPPP